MYGIKWTENIMPKGEDKELEIMAPANVRAARAFHESFPQYAETPLAGLDRLAEFLGVAKLCVKDESYRFGLNAFKVLGGSFAMARYISKLTGRPLEELSYAALTSCELKEQTGEITFFSATDGNHGRGVAWAARVLGQKAVIMMPKGSQPARFENIRAEGALTTIEDLNYDDCVRKAAKAAAETLNGVLIQDTAWEGYEEIPSWIMQGYGTMAMEADEQFAVAADAARRMYSYRRASARSPGRSSDTSRTNIPTIRRFSPSSNRTRPTASTAPPAPATEASEPSAETCAR